MIGLVSWFFSTYSKIERIIGSDRHKTKYLHITIERKNSLTIVSGFFFRGERINHPSMSCAIIQNWWISRLSSYQIFVCEFINSVSVVARQKSYYYSGYRLPLWWTLSIIVKNVCRERREVSKLILGIKKNNLKNSNSGIILFLCNFNVRFY